MSSRDAAELARDIRSARTCLTRALRQLAYGRRQEAVEDVRTAKRTLESALGAEWRE